MRGTMGLRRGSLHTSLKSRWYKHASAGVDQIRQAHFSRDQHETKKGQNSG